MKCPYCKADNSKVVDSRNYQDGLAIKRRRECIQCGKRFTTYEKVEQKPLYVIKKNKSREEFKKAKVLRGLVRATEKRNINVETLTDAVDRIEKEAYKSGGQGEIESRQLGEIIMNEIKELDEVAYVRFASVYKEFNDLKSFIKEIEQINKGEK
jgi:transcriptional repressor NrdR